MKILRNYTVTPQLPEPLARLRNIVGNLWWCWDHDAISLVRRIDPDLWESSGHNPVAMLSLVSQERLGELAGDDGFLAHYERILQVFDEYMGSETWCSRCYGDDLQLDIAYFSAEFGITECLPIYSGGLGMLAGDHLKSASDLGLPLVGVGLLYQKGYFRQHLNYDGWQGERYQSNDFLNMPIELCRNPDGAPVVVEVTFPGRNVQAQVWKVDVGRVRLYLLNTNVPENQEADRRITDQLYGGDHETRIQQELILGIGGLRALNQLGIHPVVCHMNEGHSAFLGLERIRSLMESQGVDYEAALEVCRAGTVFTTHTPVPAGIDKFSADLVRKYLSPVIRDMGIDFDRLMLLGAECCKEPDSQFSMAGLALNLSGRFNGVSRLHGEVSRSIFKEVWGDLPEEEIPIGYVTNGVHHRSWISNDMDSLYYRYLGERWHTHPEDQGVWSRTESIPHEELWRTHERRRERLVAFARARLRKQLISRGAPLSEITGAEEVLDPEILTVGFARRFATYKRADLILRNPERLAGIVNHPSRPVQIIFSGKAHPKDTPGKELIRDLVRFSERPEFRKRLVFIEDYDMIVARYLVQGVDVWLNTPRRLYEASGTSGMKAAANGVLNLSILDGWWDEAYTPEIGWAIGKGDEYDDLAYQYDVEANAIYDLLEKELVPLFYSRGSDRIPRGWTQRVKHSIKKLGPAFNTHRMVSEYTKSYYVPAAREYAGLTENNLLNAASLSEFRKRVTSLWNTVRVKSVELDPRETLAVNDSVDVAVQLDMGELHPEEVALEAVEGWQDTEGGFHFGTKWLLSDAHQSSSGSWIFTGKLQMGSSGRRALSIRMLPSHPLLQNPFTWKLLTWIS